MVTENRVSVVALRDAIVSVVDATIEQVGEGVSLDFDYFWTVIDPRILPGDPSTLDPEPTVAQVSELLAGIQAEPVGKGSDVSFLGTEMRWVAELLRAVAAHLEMDSLPDAHS